jgi:hypothetical protein
MSSSRPAATSCSVTARSSADGVGSPLGWLCTRMIAAARSAIASEHLARVHQRGVEQPPGDEDVPLQPVLRVEHGDVELLDRQVLEPRRVVLPDVARRADGVPRSPAPPPAAARARAPRGSPPPGPAPPPHRGEGGHRTSASRRSEPSACPSTACATSSAEAVPLPCRSPPRAAPPRSAPARRGCGAARAGVRRVAAHVWYCGPGHAGQPRPRAGWRDEDARHRGPSRGRRMAPPAGRTASAGCAHGCRAHHRGPAARSAPPRRAPPETRRGRRDRVRVPAPAAARRARRQPSARRERSAGAAGSASSSP